METTMTDAASPYVDLFTRLMADSNSVLGMVLASVDGHARASLFKQGHDKQAARIAAITSSVLALSESFSVETLQSKVECNSVITNGGVIITVRVPSADRALALSVWADKSDNFATILRFTRDTAQKLAVLVDTPHG